MNLIKLKYNLKSILYIFIVMTLKRYISFSKTSNCFLNTSYLCNFTNNNINYNSSLQYYIKRKQEILDRSNYDLSDKILNTTCPDKLLSYSSYIDQNKKDNWNISLRYRIMVNANILKFNQNNDIAKRLLDTNNDIILYEADDKIWGVYNNEISDDIFIENRSGRNLLGYSLMEVRDIFRTLNQSRLCE